MGRGGLRLLAMQAMWADYHPLDSPLPFTFWIQLCSSAIPLFQPGCIWELCLTLGVHCFRLELLTVSGLALPAPAATAAAMGSGRDL